ncbi:hypothetical protein AA0535_1491 [Asaia krungthepensis NRIC 0535]|uniref:Uncharacterized protein n=2 Tax=Asaia krungthepensis TaxID=220990 RepID=A0ABQ0Q2H0_9PROT|nr:hypothetical protein AA0535_1491 [Asaia krungthepensis NRIC 0535]
MDAFLRTVTIDGEAVSSLYDQWTPQEIVPLADDITCLVLADAFSGRKAVWYLDESRAYCGSHIEVVQRLQPHDILSTVSPWFDSLVRHSLAAAPQPLHDARAVPLFLATQLAAAWSVRMLGDLRQIQTALLEKGQSIAQVGEKALSTRQVRRIMGTRIGPESLVVLSPFTEKPLRSQISFVVDHQLIHRFHDAELDCSFYLAWWEKQLDKPPSFYCPKANVIISDETMAGMLPSLILGWYLSHPEHVDIIASAPGFEARDYGLGSASSLRIDTPEAAVPLPAAPNASSADMISESWAFLQHHHPAAETPSADKKDEKSSARLLGRLRSFVKKK